MRIQIRECIDLECHFRFPQPLDERAVKCCPRCGGQTNVAAEYQSHFGNTGHDNGETGSSSPDHGDNGLDCQILLDNLRSVHNVGSIFRTCDGAGVSHIHLCGTTPTPEHPRFAKTALGTEKTVLWQYYTNTLAAVRTLKNNGFYLVGLELNAESCSLFGHNKLSSLGGECPLLLIAGNEVAGIDPEVHELCDVVVHLPMAGIKSSLNVAVAVGIGVYQLKYGISKRAVLNTRGYE